jgi:hypothetical protein
VILQMFCFFLSVLFSLSVTSDVKANHAGHDKKTKIEWLNYFFFKLEILRS